MSEELTEAGAAETEQAEAATSSSLSDLKRKTVLQGKVTRLELYGAFIDVGLGTDALVHISQLGKDHVNRVADVLNIGDEVTVWVDKVDPERGQVMVTMIEPLAVEWSDLKEGNAYTGTVTRLENFGAFINIGAEREGLVHISELSHDYVKHPSEVLTVGDEVQVQVLGFSRRKRRIDLSIKALLAKPEAQVAETHVVEYDDEPEDDEGEMEDMPTAMEIALRRAMGDSYKSGGRDRDKRRKQKYKAQQDDIINRTLRAGEEN